MWKRDVVNANEPHCLRIVKQREISRLQQEAAELTYDDVDLLEAVIRYDRCHNVYSDFEDDMARQCWASRITCRSPSSKELQNLGRSYAIRRSERSALPGHSSLLTINSAATMGAIRVLFRFKPKSPK